jgi:hypothetical protein
MLTITRKVVSLEQDEVMILERIITDDDREEALRFLKKNVYKKLAASQEDRLKSHLDGDRDPAGSFQKKHE